MKLISLKEELMSNPYPGRGIVIGKSEDGKTAVTAYFIMGRAPTAATEFLLKMAKAYAQRLLTLLN